MHTPGTLPLESLRPEAGASPTHDVQIQHEVEIAGIALGVLVRLTRHAGMMSGHSHGYCQYYW